MTYFPNISYSDSANIDAFSRLRVSQPQSLFSVQCQYNASALVMEGGSSGAQGVAPAHDANTRMVKLRCTAGSGTSFMQSFQYLPYQPGKSQLTYVTGLLDAAVAAAVVDVGYFDASNGIIYRQNGTSGIEIVRRSSTSGGVVEEVVTQANWNVDKFNGTGPSGTTIDVTKVFILVIDLQFLAMGRVRVGFDVGGVIWWAHYFKHANIIAVPYMQTATLPVGMLLTATATASAKNCYFKCASVNSEGGLAEDFSYSFVTPETTVTASSGARTHLMSIRPKTTFNGIANRALIIPHHINILVTGNNPVLYELCIGQALTGTAYADINAAHSAFEYTPPATLSGSPTAVIDADYIPATNQSKGSLEGETISRFPITLDRAGAVRDDGTLTVLVTGIGGTSAVRAMVHYSEVR